MPFDARRYGPWSEGGSRPTSPAPGKRTLTDGLVQRRSTTAAAPPAATPATAAAPAAATPATATWPDDPFALHLADVVQRSGGGDASSAIATTAIERKDAGAPLDGRVRSIMESELGVALSGVRVHSDATAQRASAAIGARAFAHQADIFMGPGESAGDLRLMAHEVTHVAQQGAAGAPAVQRQVTVGAADSPAEKQADTVAERVVAQSDATAASKGLIAENGAPVKDGQLTKAAFLQLLREQVIAHARSILGPHWQADQCQDIQRWFAHHANTEAAALERLVRRYSGVSTATSATEYVAAAVARLSSAIARWGGGEELSWELAPSGLPKAAEHDGGGAAPSTPPAAQQPAPIEAGSQAQAQRSSIRLETDLGAGTALDAATVSRMGDAFGESFDHVRIHTDPVAARTTSALGADALAVGSHVAFASGAYQPGTPTGDHLLAHELAHVVQQRSAPSADRAPVQSSSAHESDADQAASAAIGRLHGGDESSAPARPALRSDLGVQRGSRTPMEQHLDGGLNNDLTENARLGTYVAEGMTALNQGHSATTGVHYAKNYRACALQPRRYPDHAARWQDDWASGYADPNYFTRTGYCTWTLRANRSASEAIKAWLKGLTIAECLSSVVALQNDALRARIGDAEFDRRYGRADGTAAADLQMVIGQNLWVTPVGHDGGMGTSTEVLPAPGNVGAIGNRPCAKGDWVYFWNHPMYRYKHPGGDWRGENAICMGNDTGVQLWSGMGAAGKTEQQMLDSMLLAYNAPRNQYDTDKLAEIQADKGGILPAIYDPAQTPILARNDLTMHDMMTHAAVLGQAGEADASVAGIDFGLIFRMNAANVGNRVP